MALSHFVSLSLRVWFKIYISCHYDFLFGILSNRFQRYVSVTKLKTLPELCVIISLSPTPTTTPRTCVACSLT